MNKTHCHRGFTLVELLASMAIIGILAAAMVSALSQAKESARKMRTRQLIAKLHEQVMPRWEAFQTRRLPITVPQPNQVFPQTTPQNPYVQNGQYSLAVGWYRLAALRELIRMEMPDRYTDLTFTPQSLVNQITINGQPQMQPVISDMRLAYSQRIASNLGMQTTGIQGLVTNLQKANGPAECLYLIVSVGATDQDLYGMTFSAADWGDTDGDNMPEFLDAWGNPISFLRWAPGFVSDMQPIYSLPQSSAGARQLAPGLPSDPSTPGNILTHYPIEIDGRAASIKYVSTFTYNNNHDAFDPLEVDPGAGVKKTPERGYNLIPLIFSAGPNGSLYDILNGTGLDGYGITTGTQNAGSTSTIDSDPYAFYPISGQQLQRGAITDGSAYDNIHNQLIGM